MDFSKAGSRFEKQSPYPADSARARREPARAEPPLELSRISCRQSARRRFKERGLPILGDDIKSQLGATITHRVLANLFRERGVRLDRTYQLNFGGNTDFLNMLERERLESKKLSKTQAVTSQLDYPLSNDDARLSRPIRMTKASAWAGGSTAWAGRVSSLSPTARRATWATCRPPAAPIVRVTRARGAQSWQPPSRRSRRYVLDRLASSLSVGACGSRCRAKLKATGIESFFALVLVSEEAGVAKPARQFFVEACRSAGVAPSECTYVGDRFDVDALASRAAGRRGLWLNRRMRSTRSGGSILCSLDELADRLRQRTAA